jgi:lipopolysaccharide transport system permease protein
MTRSFQQQVELILSLVKRDLKSRYKDSVLGFFWSFARPAFLTLILWIVFSFILQIPFHHEVVPYWLFVLVSVVSWNFFVGSLFDATGSVVANGNLLKKVKLNAEAFPIASVLANLVHFLLAQIIVVLAVVVTVGIPPYLYFLPVIVGIETLLILGIAFYLSALNVFYRDVMGLLELVVLAWFYVTPVIYPMQVAQDRVGNSLGSGWFTLYMLNPIAPIVGAIRRVTLYGRGKGEIHAEILVTYLSISLLLSIVLCVSGWFVFRRLSDRFADEL